MFQVLNDLLNGQVLIGKSKKIAISLRISPRMKNVRKKNKRVCIICVRCVVVEEGVLNTICVFLMFGEVSRT